MFRNRIAAAAVALCSSGCASIVSGVYQPISLETRVNGVAVAGAACTLSSNKGTWFVTSPASVTVHRGFQDIAVECSKPGLEPSLTTVPSHVRAIAFGNLLFGGLIGVAVDSGDGAAFDYPDLFTIEMVESRQQSKAPAIVAPGAAAAAARAGTSTQATATTADRAPRRFQLDAERFAVDRTCAAKPMQATFTARGPGYEVYRIPCASGAVLIARCDFGACRSVE